MNITYKVGALIWLTALFNQARTVDGSVTQKTTKAAHVVGQAAVETAHVMKDKAALGVRQIENAAHKTIAKAKVGHYQDRAANAADQAVRKADQAIEYKKKAQIEKIAEAKRSTQFGVHSTAEKAHIAVEQSRARAHRHQAVQEIKVAASTAATKAREAVDHGMDNAKNFISTTVAHAKEDHARRREREAQKRGAHTIHISHIETTKIS